MATSGRRLVNVVNLGRMGYMAAYDVQMRYARQHLDFLAGKPGARSENVLLLVEHKPVYTTGIRTKKYSDQEETFLKSLGAEFYRTNRGGLITFHGPGQLVAYPIINLKDFEPSMKWFIGALEKTMINTCSFFNLEATTTENTGVWIKDRKIGAIGVHGSRYITTHGVSLNCSTDLSWYDKIVPCGLEDKEVTSLSKELQQKTTIKDAVGPFLKAFKKQFDCEVALSLLEEKDIEFIESFEKESSKAESIQPVG